MADAYLGQIMCTGFGFAPSNWAKCDGQEMLVQQNQALFALVRTRFGGDGVTSFYLPDLRGRTPVGGGFASQSGPVLPAYALGQAGGAETASLVVAQLPNHPHMAHASDVTASGASPSGGVFGVTGVAAYGSGPNVVTLGKGPTTSAGGALPHANMQPFQVINMCICVAGPTPPRT